jgi:hypothetical protein
MTLHIGKLATRCLAPRGREAAGALVDSVAREVLPRELGERLGPSLDRQVAVVRLKLLNITLRITPEELDQGRLAAAWAAAFARALLEALARPDGDGERLRRFASRASYVAAMIAYASRGPPEGGPWQFPELVALAGRHPAIVVLDLLLESGPLLGDVLEELSRAGKLIMALGLLDEVGMERVLRTIGEAEGRENALTGEQLVAIASALVALRTPPGGGEAATRRRAVELWLRFRRGMPLRGIWYGTKLLLLFLEEPALLAGAWEDRSAHWPAEARGSAAHALTPSLLEKMSRFPEWCERLRRRLSDGQLQNAAAVLEELRQITPSAAPSLRGAGVLWLRSGCAGILLLYPVILRLGWFRFYRDPDFGPRAFQALIAGAAMRLLYPWQPGDKVELAPGLLAGFAAEADRLGIAQVFASTPRTALDLFPQADDWPSVLDSAADALALGLASCIRGFHKAGRESIVRHFLRIPGQILIEERELRVVLDPSPWSVVLHVSGADDALPDIEWLGRRRVTYVLEGL